jgi:hypothetical protein
LFKWKTVSLFLLKGKLIVKSKQGPLRTQMAVDN